MSIKKQLNKEGFITLGLYFFYFLWWFYFAYLYSDSEDVKNFKYILGLPEWFFYSCIVGFILVNFLVFIAVKLFFKNIPLEEDKKC